MVNHRVCISATLVDDVTLFPTVAVQIYIPTDSMGGVPFFLPLLKHLLFAEFLIMAIVIAVR